MYDSSVSLDGSGKSTIDLIFAHGLDEVAKGKIPMRTVAQFLSTGIQTVADLQESLGLAAKLEFSTLPPYLCAEWSIKDQSDPVVLMIHGIVLQEMLHMGLVCNMLIAIGGQPRLANSGFVPTYPTDGLPGNVHPHLRVDLLPLGAEALQTFMQIEYPEKGPITLNVEQIFPTIGEFYDAISAAFEQLQPPMGPARQVVASVQGDELFAISSVDDAKKAIEEIKEQGEGTTSSPTGPSFDPAQLAHYYTFKEISEGHILQKGSDGNWHFNGTTIPNPPAYSFAPATDPQSSTDFNTALSDLLRLLEQAWTQDPNKIGKAIGQMQILKRIGTAMIKSGIRPEFKWSDSSALHP